MIREKLTGDQWRMVNALFSGERVACSDADLDAFIDASMDEEKDPFIRLASIPNPDIVGGYIAFLK